MASNKPMTSPTTGGRYVTLDAVDRSELLDDAVVGTSRKPARGVAATMVACWLTIAIALAVSTSPTASATTASPTTASATTASATTTAHTCVPASNTGSVSRHVTRARAALDAAIASLQDQRHRAAVTNLRTLKKQVRKAHTAAKALIGLPPTDPESDDPPGVAAVLNVAGLEHRVTTQLAPRFDGLDDDAVVGPLGNALIVADTCRHVLLRKVIALAAGKLDDYSDGLADTLPGYKNELGAIHTALTMDDLATLGRSALEEARQVVAATQEKMKKAFGGGERSP
jgi:hypothetical protein